ncbi:MAG: 16S rRNA (cytosine(1402)-N(4))-methyltransferase RsmH [Rectinema sp.]
MVKEKSVQSAQPIGVIDSPDVFAAGSAPVLHVPVMLPEVLALFALTGTGSDVLDCTLGEGGHAEALLTRYSGISYTAIDADPEARARAAARLLPFADRLRILPGYFDEVLASLETQEPTFRPDFVFFDLGVSMYHFAGSNRGFSYAADEPLDMRFSPDAPRSAADLVNGLREEELADLIYKYGEEKLSRRIAHAIVESRSRSPVRTSAKLADVVRGAVPAQYRYGRIHPATRTFQALRIAVNSELDRAERGIAAASRIVAPGGILAVISFHSLEDRVAKLAFRSLTRGSGWEDLSRKPLLPAEAEIASNPPSRSAKMRAARSPLAGAAPARSRYAKSGPDAQGGAA